MKCVDGIGAEVLADYWLGALASAEEANFEEHLFACESCSARLREVIAMAEGLKRLARSGALMMVVDGAHLEQAGKEGLKIREYAVSPGGSVNCTITAEDDLLVGRLAAKLGGAKRVDVLLHGPNGEEIGRLADIPFDPVTDTVLWQQSSVYAKGAASGVLVTRLVSVDDAGAESLLGEYTFVHERTIPGPASW